MSSLWEAAHFVYDHRRYFMFIYGPTNPHKQWDFSTKTPYETSRLGKQKKPTKRKPTNLRDPIVYGHISFQPYVHMRGHAAPGKYHCSKAPTCNLMYFMQNLAELCILCRIAQFMHDYALYATCRVMHFMQNSAIYARLCNNYAKA